VGVDERTQSGPRTVRRRVESFLDTLHRQVPYSAALVTTHDPVRGQQVEVASRGYRREVVTYVVDEFLPRDPSFRLVASRPSDILHWNTLPGFRRSPVAAGYLIPAGFRQGSSMVLDDARGRPFGSLHVSLDEDLVTPATLGALAMARRTVIPLAAADRRRRGTTLSARELEVLHHLCDGLSNTEIAAALWVSRRTVATHIEHILRKLRTTNRVQAAVRAVALGLVEPAGDDAS
jgi:DNA-binding CsgD family transcriptional regulator